MGRPSPEPGPAVAAWAVRACWVADRRRSIPARRRPEPPADEQHQNQRQQAKQTRPPTHAQGRQQTASAASQAETRHHPPAPPAPAERQPSKRAHPRRYQTRAFSSPPLIAIHPLLYPPPVRRRVLPAQTRTFAGSRAQKLIRCDAIFPFPAGPGEKMEGGQKIWNAHAGGSARGKRNAGTHEIEAGIIFAASRKWSAERSCGGTALRWGGNLVRGGTLCSDGRGFWYAGENYFSELATFAGFSCYIDIVQ